MARKKPVLIAKDISLTYEIRALRNNKNRWTKLSSAIIGHKKSIRALEEMSLVLNSGEVICLIGSAGSGKSSLVDTLGGALKPDTGEIWASESPVILNSNFAFFGQLSGVENVRLALLSMGFSKEKVSMLTKEILESAKIKKIAHNPINSYSTTIKKKLMLEVAIAQKPKVLFLDQKLNLRGIEERTEFENRIKLLSKSGCCIVFVGLRPKQISQLCNRVIWLEQGQIKQDGTVNKVLPLYRKRKR